MGVVIADLRVAGKSHGPHPFVMQMRNCVFLSLSFLSLSYSVCVPVCVFACECVCVWSARVMGAILLSCKHVNASFSLSRIVCVCVCVCVGVHVHVRVRVRACAYGWQESWA